MAAAAQDQSTTLFDSNFNLEQLNTKQLEEHLSASIQAGSNVCIFGRRGTGKSSIVQQRIALADCIEAYCNVSLFERVDLGGYPNLMGEKSTAKTKAERFIDYILPRMYQAMIEGEKSVVLLLDEVDKASPDLWAPLLEITQEKSINGRKLPNLRCSIMTGNLIAEGGTRPSLPLLDRCEAYTVSADAQSWLIWAAASNLIHPSIYRYISDHPKQLFGAVDGGENYKDQSPRGWHLASKMLFAGEANGWSLQLMMEKCAGYLGKRAGVAYKNYYSNYKVLLPIIDQIFRGEPYQEDWKKLTPTEKLYGTTIICSRFAAQLDAATPETPPASLDLIGVFFKTCSYENVLMSIRSQLQAKRIARYALWNNPHWSILEEVNKAANAI